MENKETFNYTYSAKEQEEIKAIRRKYCGREEENKMARLRRLDAGVTQKASSISLAVGIIGALIMGTGMSLVMTDLGRALELSNSLSLIVGIITGVFGLILVSCAYPLYNRVVRRERQKIAPEIIILTDELLK